MKKYHFIGICVVASLAIIGGYIFDIYRANKLIDLKAFQGGQLVGDALNLKMYKFIQESIDKGEIDELKKVLSEHISNQEKSISAKLNNYPLDETQLKIIKSALEYDGTSFEN